MSTRSPRQPNPGAKRRPGRPPLGPVTAIRPYSVVYLVRAAKLQPETINLLVAAWQQLDPSHKTPRPARVWKLEAQSAIRAAKTLARCGETWLASGEVGPIATELRDALREVAWIGRLAAIIGGMKRNRPNDKFRRASVRLRFAVRMAQMQPKLGLNMKARHVAALAVVAEIEPPTMEKPGAEQRRLLSWERTWKAGKRLAAQLQAEAAGINRQPVAPNASSGRG